MKGKNADEHQLLDILKKIDESGSATEDWIVLINGAFKSDENETSNEKLQKWAIENKLRFNEEIISQGKKKEVFIRFTRLK